mgnify:CR=1 FL=1
MKEFKISEKIAQAILNYLVVQPFKDVFQLINELQKLEEIKKEVLPEEPEV